MVNDPSNNPFTYPEGFGANNDYGYGMPSGQAASYPGDPNDYQNPLGINQSPTDNGGGSSLHDAPYSSNSPLTSSQWLSKAFPNGVVNSDVFDLGKTAIGLYGATRPLPQFSKSPRWVDYVNHLQRLSNMGLTPEEYSLAKSNADRAYASDTANIQNLSGGNAGVALGNQGRAIASLYHHNADLAVADANMRRENLQRYGEAVGQDQNIDRQIFMDKLAHAEHSQQLGAKLASDSLTNMSSRAQYNKQYGPGSQYSKWLNIQMNEAADRDELMKRSAAAYLQSLETPDKTPDKTPTLSAGELYPGVPIPQMPEQGTGAYVKYPPTF